MYTLRPRRAYGQICGLTRVKSAKQALRRRKRSRPGPQPTGEQPPLAEISATCASS
jgi:hypothetical protein